LLMQTWPLFEDLNQMLIRYISLKRAVFKKTPLSQLLYGLVTLKLSEVETGRVNASEDFELRLGRDSGFYYSGRYLEIPCAVGLDLFN